MNLIEKILKRVKDSKTFNDLLDEDALAEKDIRVRFQDLPTGAAAQTMPSGEIIIDPSSFQNGNVGDFEASKFIHELSHALHNPNYLDKPEEKQAFQTQIQFLLEEGHSSAKIKELLIPVFTDYKNPEEAKELIDKLLTDSKKNLSASTKYKISKAAEENKFYYSDGSVLDHYDLTKTLHREGAPAIEYSGGTKEWYLNGKRHREGAPAVEHPSGYRAWYLDGSLHREGGPAVEYADGTKEWYFNNRLHREGGPAVERSDGTKFWYVNGVPHREDGPAIEHFKGEGLWYLNGVVLQDPDVAGPLKQQFQKKLKDIHKVQELSEKLSSSKFPYDIKVVPKRIQVARKIYHQPVILLLPNEQTKQLLGEDLFNYYSSVETHRKQNEIAHARVNIHDNTWVIEELQSDKLARVGEDEYNIPKPAQNKIRKIFKNWKYELIDLIKTLAKKENPNNKVLLTPAKIQEKRTQWPGKEESPVRQKFLETYDVPAQKLKLPLEEQENPIPHESGEDKEYYRVAKIKSFTKFATLQKFTLTSEEQKIVDRIQDVAEKLGITVYLAGGLVRDRLLGKDNNDLDFVTDKDSEKLAYMLAKQHSLPDPIKMDKSGATMVRMGDKSLDIIDAEKVFSPLKAGSLEEGQEAELSIFLDDAYRRDLTINSLMYNIHTGELFDPTEKGMQDLQNKVIRTIIDPNLKYRVHAPDMLRAIRFYSTMPGFKFAPGMLEAMRENASKVLPRDQGGDISARRIERELRKAIKTPETWNRMKGALAEAGLTEYIGKQIKDVQTDMEGDIKYNFDKTASRSVIVYRGLEVPLEEIENVNPLESKYTDEIFVTPNFELAKQYATKDWTKTFDQSTGYLVAELSVPLDRLQLDPEFLELLLFQPTSARPKKEDIGIDSNEPRVSNEAFSAWLKDIAVKEKAWNWCKDNPDNHCTFVIPSGVGKVIKIHRIVKDSREAKEGSLSKLAKKIKMDPKELVEEHEHLVKVLKSPSHKDDLEEAKKQSKELKEYKEEAKASSIKSFTRTSQVSDAQINAPTVQVDPSIQKEVQQAVQELTKMDPSFFKGVSKIVALTGGPFGQVTSKDPSIVQINISRIKQEVQRQLGTQQINPSDPQHQEVFDEALKRSIVETVAHERAHVLDYNSETGTFPGGEGVAEQAEQEALKRLQLDKPIETARIKSFTKIADKIILHSDPDWFGVDIQTASWTNPFKDLPIVDIPIDKLEGYEPSNKMDSPESQSNMQTLMKNIQAGESLPPILVRKYGKGYQVLDGHHRFHAFKALGKESIRAKVIPDEDIIEAKPERPYSDAEREASKHPRLDKPIETANIKSFTKIATDTNFERLLDQTVAEDQKYRNIYKTKYLSKFENWQDAAKAFASDYGTTKEDLFGDRTRLTEIRPIIQKHIDTILADKNLLNKAWVVVQHMDEDVGFQRWFLSQLPQDTTEYQYLYDRVAINTGESQKYDTQRAFPIKSFTKIAAERVIESIDGQNSPPPTWFNLQAVRDNGGLYFIGRVNMSGDARPEAALRAAQMKSKAAALSFMANQPIPGFTIRKNYWRKVVRDQTLTIEAGALGFLPWELIYKAWQDNKIDKNQMLQKINAKVPVLSSLQAQLRRYSINSCIKCGYGFAGKKPHSMGKDYGMVPMEVSDPQYREDAPCPSCNFQAVSEGAEEQKKPEFTAEKYYVDMRAKGTFIGPFYSESDAEDMGDEIVELITEANRWTDFPLDLEKLDIVNERQMHKMESNRAKNRLDEAKSLNITDPEALEATGYEKPTITAPSSERKDLKKVVEILKKKHYENQDRESKEPNVAHVKGITRQVYAIKSCVRCGYGFAGKKPNPMGKEYGMLPMESSDPEYKEDLPCPSCGLQAKTDTEEVEKSEGFGEKYYVDLTEGDEVGGYVGPFYVKADAEEMKNEIHDLETEQNKWNRHSSISTTKIVNEREMISQESARAKNRLDEARSLNITGPGVLDAWSNSKPTIRTPSTIREHYKDLTEFFKEDYYKHQDEEPKEPNVASIKGITRKADVTDITDLLEQKKRERETSEQAKELRRDLDLPSSSSDELNEEYNKYFTDVLNNWDWRNIIDPVVHLWINTPDPVAVIDVPTLKEAQKIINTLPRQYREAMRPEFVLRVGDRSFTNIDDNPITHIISSVEDLMKFLKHWSDKGHFENPEIKLSTPLHIEKDPKRSSLTKGLTRTAYSEASVIAVFDDSNNILMGRRNDSDKWTLPGGGAEEDESPEETAIRELKEEAGLNVKKEDLTYVGSKMIEGKNLLVHCFKTYHNGEPDSSQDPDEEVDTWDRIPTQSGLPESVIKELHNQDDPTLYMLGLRKEATDYAGRPLPNTDALPTNLTNPYPVEYYNYGRNTLKDKAQKRKKIEKQRAQKEKEDNDVPQE